MDENVRKSLIDAQIDVDEAMERLVGNYGLLERFLKRFPTDDNFNKLEKYLDEGNCEAAFRACHTIKGVCANLSMNKLKDIISQQVEFLRVGQLQQAQDIMPQVNEMYKKMVADITKIYG